MIFFVLSSPDYCSIRSIAQKPLIFVSLHWLLAVDTRFSCGMRRGRGSGRTAPSTTTTPTCGSSCSSCRSTSCTICTCWSVTSSHHSRRKTCRHAYACVWCIELPVTCGCVAAVGQHLPEHGQSGDLHAAAALVLRRSAPPPTSQELQTRHPTHA